MPLFFERVEHQLTATLQRYPCVKCREKDIRCHGHVGWICDPCSLAKTSPGCCWEEGQQPGAVAEGKQPAREDSELRSALRPYAMLSLFQNLPHQKKLEKPKTMTPQPLVSAVSCA